MPLHHHPDLPRTTASPPAFLGALGIEPPAWTGDALCAQVDNDIFFPEPGGSNRAAKAICARCPVAADCLAYALDNSERFGIWGGRSERERHKMRKAAA